jgi:hypothetical protein
MVERDQHPVSRVLFLRADPPPDEGGSFIELF